MFLYAANEIGKYGSQKSGPVSAFAIDRVTGKLTFLIEGAELRVTRSEARASLASTRKCFSVTRLKRVFIRSCCSCRCTRRFRRIRIATVVSGTWYFGYGDHFDAKSLKQLPPGGVYSEPGAHNHFARTEKDAVIVQISGYGPTYTRYFNLVSSRLKTTRVRKRKQLFSIGVEGDQPWLK